MGGSNFEKPPVANNGYYSCDGQSMVRKWLIMVGNDLQLLLAIMAVITIISHLILVIAIK